MDSRHASFVSNSSFFSVCETPTVKRSQSRYASLLNSTSRNNLEISSINNITFNGSSLPETFVSFNQTTFREDSPPEEAFPCFSLFRSFLDCHRRSNDSEDFITLLEEYINDCCDHLSALQALKAQQSRKDNMLPPKMETLLKFERNSWCLLRTLYKDSSDKDSPMQDEGIISDIAPKRLSDTDVISKLYDSSSHVRKMQLVIDWLEGNERADIDADNYSDKIEFYSEGPHYWENTLHMLKSRTAKVSNCQEMDPDAPIRGKTSIHHLDLEDEGRLMKHILKNIRAGRFELAREIAEKLGYHWLSVALSGWQLHHDVNFDEGLTDSGGDFAHCEGNFNRMIWKYTCFKCSNITDSNSSLYEAAIFGVLSGNIKPALQIMNRWSDKLWALTRASLDVEIEQELRMNTSQNIVTARVTGSVNSFARSNVDLPDEYWNNLKDFDLILREVDAMIDQNQLSSEERCHQSIQKLVILENVDSILEFIVDWIRNKEDDDIIRPHLLRFFAHVVLFFMKIGHIDENRETFSTTILEEYINYLIQWKEIELVASYVSHLPKTKQVPTYVRLLEGISDRELREHCLKVAKENNLDTALIAKSVVESIHKPQETTSTLQLTSRPASPSDLNQETEEDRFKIDALEWLIVDEVRFFDLIIQSNALIRYFILNSKTEAAKTTLHKLPSNLIDGAQNSFSSKLSIKKVPAKLINATREHLCHKTYIHANDAFNEWLELFCNGKPKEPKPVTTNRFVDKVSYQHATKQYENDVEEWKGFLERQAKITYNKIHNVLCFEGGWMVDKKDDPDDFERETRLEQMKKMRREVIPKLIFALHMVLNSSNLLVKCIQLADIIASEKWALYKELTPEQIQVLLQKFRETSILLLNEGTDGFGYKTIH